MSFTHTPLDPAKAQARKARLHRGMYLLPSLFTSVNIGAGYWSITQSIEAVTGNAQAHLDLAAIAILFAIPFDALDGRIEIGSGRDQQTEGSQRLGPRKLSLAAVHRERKIIMLI